MHFVRTVFQIVVLVLSPRLPTHSFVWPRWHDISLDGSSDNIVVKENSIVTRSFTISCGTCSSLEDNFAVEVSFSRAFSIYGRSDCVVRFTNRSCFGSSPPQVCRCGPTAQQFTVTRRVGGPPGEMWNLCLITGDYRFVNCQFFEIRVLYAQQKITSLTVTTNSLPVSETSPVTRNATATVTCVWEVGYPPQTARLTKDGDELSPASVRHNSDEPDRSLRQIDYVIQHAQCNDSGLITCEAAGSAHNKSFMLLVKYDPVITSLTVTTNGFPVNETSPVTRNITVTGNTTVTVTCFWEEGCPPQTARLTKDGDELSSASVRHYNDTKRRSLRQIDYVIQHAQCSDSGLITCETAGSAHNKSFMLLVKSATKTSRTVSAVALILVQGILFFGVLTVFCCAHFRHRISCRRAAPRRSRNVRQDAARAEGVVFRPAPPTVQLSRDSFLGHNDDTNAEGPDDGDQVKGASSQWLPPPHCLSSRPCILSGGYIHLTASPVGTASRQVATSTPVPLQQKLLSHLQMPQHARHTCRSATGSQRCLVLNQTAHVTQRTEPTKSGSE